MGLRAWSLGQGLRAHGFQIAYATRRADGDDATAAAPSRTYEGDDDLRDLVTKIAPDVIVAVAADEVSRLPDDGPPLVLDLFAPRLLERQFQDLAGDDEVIRLLDAIGRADHFLFSNPRQRDFHLGLLTAAGVDCRELPGAVVPLACPPEYPRRSSPREPVLVSGGVFWPWNDARAPLGAVLEHLERRGRGELHLFGGVYPIEGVDGGRSLDPRAALPESPRLQFQGFVPYDELIQRYARATAAVDLALPNVERELSFGFRHVDYLRAGLPMVVGAGTEAAAELVPAGAALAVDPLDHDAIQRTLDRLLDDGPLRSRMSRAARAHARAFHAWETAVAPLAAYCQRPRLRRTGSNVLVATARERDQLAADLSRAKDQLVWTRERLDESEAEREAAWKHHRDAVARLDKAWASLRTIRAERDEAWKAHAKVLAEQEQLHETIAHLEKTLATERERLGIVEARREQLLDGLDETRDQIRDFEVELRRAKDQLEQTIGWRLKRLADRARSS
jgi:Glycosyl transferases group 1